MYFFHYFPHPKTEGKIPLIWESFPHQYSRWGVFRVLSVEIDESSWKVMRKRAWMTVAGRDWLRVRHMPGFAKTQQKSQTHENHTNSTMHLPPYIFYVRSIHGKLDCSECRTACATWHTIQMFLTVTDKNICQIKRYRLVERLRRLEVWVVVANETVIGIVYSYELFFHSSDSAVRQCHCIQSLVSHGAIQC